MKSRNGLNIKIGDLWELKSGSILNYSHLLLIKDFPIGEDNYFEAFDVLENKITKLYFSEPPECYTLVCRNAATR